MRSAIKTILIACFLFFTISCASYVTQNEMYSSQYSQWAKAKIPPVGKAIVYIMQPYKHYVKKDIASKVYFDDRYLGSVGNNTFIYTIVEPGKHSITTNKLIPAKNTKITFETKANRTYFVTQRRLTGPLPTLGYELAQVDHLKGADDLAKCDLSKNISLNR